MDQGIWEEIIRENADKEGVRPCNRNKRRICTKEGKGVSVAKGGKERDERVY